jgi:hypothetical protein
MIDKDNKKMVDTVLLMGGSKEFFSRSGACGIVCTGYTLHQSFPKDGTCIECNNTCV